MSHPFPPAPSITIDKATARRFMFAHHHLWPPRQLKGKPGVRQFIRHVAGIQFDPINIVGRNPDLVLQSRVKDFGLSLLDELLYEDRLLLDGWDKMASIYSVEDWPYFTRQRNRMQDVFGVPNEVVMKVAPDLMEKIGQDGPQSPLDFKGDTKTDWAWGPTKVSRAGLEGLYAMGKLGIHHRVNNRRYFDFIENLLPSDLLDTLDPNESTEEYENWHILRRVAGMGLVFPNAGEHWYGINAVKTPERKRIISRLVETDNLVALAIGEIPDKVFYIRKADMQTLEAVQSSDQPKQGAAILAPLDNLLWNRKMNGWLFDFEYIWEVYKPKAQRKYGYYVLPVIYGDRFIARFDPAFDKKSRKLTIQNWWWEVDVELDDEMEIALINCLRDFVAYLDARGFEIGEQIKRIKTLQWMKKIQV